jgi:hypothetical protein
VFGYGLVSGFNDGIADNSITLFDIIGGMWKATPGGPMFSANRIGITNELPANSGFVIDPLQISGTRRYQNRSKKDVDYQLTIQRSTGRFSETYTYADGSNSVPFSQETGRCAKLPAK